MIERCDAEKTFTNNKLNLPLREGDLAWHLCAKNNELPLRRKEEVTLHKRIFCLTSFM